jgi:hypothetical protein
MTALHDKGEIGALGPSAVTIGVLERDLPAGVACVQNTSRGAERLT